MQKVLAIAVVASAILIVGCKKPADPTGSWKGAVTLPASVANDPKLKANAANVALDLNKDHTFSLQKAYEGTWKFDAGTVSLSITKVGGKDLADVKQQFVKAMGQAKADEMLNGADKPLPMKLSDDGKTMTGSLPAGAGQAPLAVTFTKQEAAAS